MVRGEVVDIVVGYDQAIQKTPTRQTPDEYFNQCPGRGHCVASL